MPRSLARLIGGLPTERLNCSSIFSHNFHRGKNQVTSLLRCVVHTVNYTCTQCLRRTEATRGPDSPLQGQLRGFLNAMILLPITTDTCAA